MEEPNPVGTLREQLAWRIREANVPHPMAPPMLGGLESRSLGYYASVGIDYFGHDPKRYNALLFKAADSVLELLAPQNRPNPELTPTHKP